MIDRMMNAKWLKDDEMRRIAREIERRREELGPDRSRERAVEIMAAITAHPEVVSAGRMLSKRKRGRR